MIELIEYVVPIYAGSNLIFEMIILNIGFLEVSAFDYLGLVIGIAHAFLPMGEINEKLFPDD